MPASGTKQTYQNLYLFVRFWSEADMAATAASPLAMRFVNGFPAADAARKGSGITYLDKILN
jgi:hypothetical protein